MSKAYGFASWCIGWMVFPTELEPTMQKIQDTVIICPPVIPNMPLPAPSAKDTHS
jgi:aspartate/methionine/tyrosine aminotransferase